MCAVWDVPGSPDTNLKANQSGATSTTTGDAGEAEKSQGTWCRYPSSTNSIPGVAIGVFTLEIDLTDEVSDVAVATLNGELAKEDHAVEFIALSIIWSDEPGTIVRDEIAATFE